MFSMQVFSLLHKIVGGLEEEVFLFSDVLALKVKTTFIGLRQLTRMTI